MNKVASNVVPLHRRKPREALEHLNRLTGLKFARWPESLLGYCPVENLQGALPQAMKA